MQGLKKQIRNLPKSPGIYQFLDKGGKILYIGKSVSLKNRVSSYFTVKNLSPKTQAMVRKVVKIKYIEVFSEFEAQLLEAELIKKNQPFFNTQAKDDKSPLYIKITSDPIPLVNTVRRQAPPKGVFIKGPFTSTAETREILRGIRRIFPFCHHKNPKKPCLYVHLGLCSYPYAHDGAKKNYLQNIANVKKLLIGSSKSLIKNLTSQMEKASKDQKFEEAAKIKKQLEMLRKLFTIYHAPAEFLANPSLVDDIKKQRLISLSKVLNLKKQLIRIECYDISNIGGKNATGAMVVFTNGQPERNEYRKFRIKFVKKPNDYQMIKEVLLRRFKNNWPKPDLIVIDGGLGQVNIAYSIVKTSKLNIPLVGLAKKFERLYLPHQKKPIDLSADNPARLLSQEIRDETHRFAINYHRLLRQKSQILRS